MSSFADSMKSFTEQLKSSIHEREDALARVHQNTDDLLKGAREFMDGVSREHRERADDLRAAMTEFRAELDRKVGEMKHQHRESHRQRSEHLNQMLGETRKARHEAVSTMQAEFHKAQHELADDLRQAANAWREFAATR